MRPPDPQPQDRQLLRGGGLPDPTPLSDLTDRQCRAGGELLHDLLSRLAGQRLQERLRLRQEQRTTYDFILDD